MYIYIYIYTHTHMEPGLSPKGTSHISTRVPVFPAVPVPRPPPPPPTLSEVPHAEAKLWEDKLDLGQKYGCRWALGEEAHAGPRGFFGPVLYLGSGKGVGFWTNAGRRFFFFVFWGGVWRGKPRKKRGPDCFFFFFFFSSLGCAIFWAGLY